MFCSKTSSHSQQVSSPCLASVLGSCVQYAGKQPRWWRWSHFAFTHVVCCHECVDNVSWLCMLYDCVAVWASSITECQTVYLFALYTWLHVPLVKCALCCYLLSDWSLRKLLAKSMGSIVDQLFALLKYQVIKLGSGQVSGRLINAYLCGSGVVDRLTGWVGAGIKLLFCEHLNLNFQCCTGWGNRKYMIMVLQVKYSLPYPIFTAPPQRQ